jgi:TonB family protein
VCGLPLKRLLCVITLLLAYFAGTSSAQSPAATSDSASNSSSAGNERIYQAGKDGVSSPSCFYSPGPPSTEEAQAAKFEGVVIADVVVTAKGRIENVRIVKSPGLGLDESVRETLGKWRCQPAKLEGKAVPVKLEFEFSFLVP